MTPLVIPGKRKLVRVSAVLLSLAIAGCDSEPTVVNDEVAAEDSALKLAVFTAAADTTTVVVDDRPVVDVFLDVVASQSTILPTKPAPQPEPVRAAFTDVTAKQSTARRMQPSIAVVRQQPKPAPLRAVEQPVAAAEIPAAAPEPKRVAREEEDRSVVVGIIPSGSALSLRTNEKVCDGTSRAGRTFSAVVTEPLRGSNGVTIPSGAHAVAEITGGDTWGSGIGVRVTSVRHNRRTYSVRSDVGYVLPGRGGCIPERTRIELETKAPLRVAEVN